MMPDTPDQTPLVAKTSSRRRGTVGFWYAIVIGLASIVPTLYLVINLMIGAFQYAQADNWEALRAAFYLAPIISNIALFTVLVVSLRKRNPLASLFGLVIVTTAAVSGVFSLSLYFQSIETFGSGLFYAIGGVLALFSLIVYTRQYRADKALAGEAGL